ncbi:MAG: lipolytic protein G-D-S-L family [Phycisphaerales bacterium]|nr:lipolytic protein G-D-S-L family [Phycisphaerales bacterium]
MKSLLAVVAIAAICWMPAPASAEGKIAVTKGQTIAFLGDSITAAGARNGGYCKLVLDGLKQQGIEAKGVFAGISGHKSNQMLGRLEKDVISKKPDWMTLSCGVNDVWHGARGVALEPYKKNITEIVTKAQAAGIKVMLLTSTMIGEDQPNARNQKLLPYNAFIRQLAKDKNCLLADLNTDMQEALKKFPKERKGNKLTGDGVHMNAAGNRMMALGLLKAFGLTDAQLTSTEKGWRDMPNTSRVRVQIGMSANEAEKLNAIAAKAKKSLSQLFTEFLNEKKAAMLKE